MTGPPRGRLLTAAETAALFGVTARRVATWRRMGLIPERCFRRDGPGFLYEAGPPLEDAARDAWVAEKVTAARREARRRVRAELRARL